MPRTPPAHYDHDFLSAEELARLAAIQRQLRPIVEARVARHAAWAAAHPVNPPVRRVRGSPQETEK